MLTLRGLSKSYVAGVPVLQDVNLEIAARGITAIIGASGTGKSTLIRCINRLVEPTSGAILFEDQDLARLSGAALRRARRHIGMVFQEYNLVERLTVMENLLSRAPRLRFGMARVAAPVSAGGRAARLRASRPRGPRRHSPPSAPMRFRAASASASASRVP